jgi:hypothetical protein
VERVRINFQNGHGSNRQKEGGSPGQARREEGVDRAELNRPQMKKSAGVTA